jgi:hypothetical protein
MLEREMGNLSNVMASIGSGNVGDFKSGGLHEKQQFATAKPSWHLQTDESRDKARVEMAGTRTLQMLMPTSLQSGKQNNRVDP